MVVDDPSPTSSQTNVLPPEDSVDLKDSIPPLPPPLNYSQSTLSPKNSQDIPLIPPPSLFSPHSSGTCDNKVCYVINSAQGLLKKSHLNIGGLQETTKGEVLYHMISKRENLSKFYTSHDHIRLQS